MNQRISIVAGLACVLGVAGCATKTVAPPAPTIATGQTSTAKGGSRQQEITITATVEKIDLKERLVTLRGPDGATKTIRVSDEARNLAQVKRGDQVVVTYYESIAFHVLKPGEAKIGIAEAEDAARAELGQKPGGVTARSVVVVAKIVKLDRPNQQAVLLGPEKKTFTVNVKNPAHFDKVKVGDTVEIVYTEAFGIDVTPASKN